MNRNNMSIAENVKEVFERVARAAEDSGRAPEDISVVAATKMNSADRVREAIAAGIRICGENRVQELTEKDALGAYEGAERHFIGRLQKNKVRFVVGRCSLIQSVDSPELMEQISARAQKAGIRQKALVEVNIGREEAKSGVLVEDLDGLLSDASGMDGIFIEGLMAIPPVSVQKGESRKYFDEMYKLFVDIAAKKYDNVDMRLLSMGMSGDFEEAIMSGANMVRIGTSIFGHRQYT